MIPGIVQTLWVSTKGEAWEPPDPKAPLIEKLIVGGWVRRTDGRVGFERMKDAMLTWTDAGRVALSARLGPAPHTAEPETEEER